MTQEERLLARLRSLDASSLYALLVYVRADGTLGFWLIEKKGKIEGEPKHDTMPVVERLSV